MRNDFQYSKLNAPDVVRRFLQECRFAVRKPLFYPLNYGNSDNCDFRFFECGLQTAPTTGLRKRINRGL
jgi:hypothetical protein